MDFFLTSFQDRFLFSEKKYPAFVAGWGTGKSMTAIFRALLFSQETPNNLGLIIRKNFTDLRDSTIKDFTRYTGIQVSEQTKDAKMPNGSIIMFRHGDELDVLKNMNLGFAFIEQAEEFETSEQWFYLLGRLRRETARRSAWITANTNGHNWVWELWKDKAHTPEYELTEAVTYDNAKNLPADFIESLKDQPKMIFDRFVMNDWNIAEGLVWPEFDEKKHTGSSFEIPEDWKDSFALDHGFDHPTAVVFAAVNYDGKLIFYDEHCESRQLVSYHSRRIKEIEPSFGRMRRWIDPSCRNKIMQKEGTIYSVIDEYQDHGIGFLPAQNDWEAGVNRVGEAFKNDQILIFEDKCPKLIAQLKTYKYKAQRPGKEKMDERPLKINDDLCDALRYLIASRPQTPVVPKLRSRDRAFPLAYELIEK